MTGFIRGLFGKKDSKPEQPKDAFFLDDDTAKSLGNLDYMRQPKAIRRTFPKSVSSPDKKELVQEISAMDKVVVRSQGTILNAGGVKPRVGGASQIQPKTIAQSSFTPAPTPAPAPEAASAPAAEVAPPQEAPAPETPQPRFQPQRSDTAKRTPDSNMDMFRNMAKNMGR